MTESILSDENLVKYIEEDKIKDILVLFSNGKFLALVNKYIMIEEKPTTPATSTPEQNAQAKTPTPNIMFANMNMNNNQKTPPPPQPKFILNLDILEKCNEDKLTQQILLTIIIFCLLKTNKIEDAKIIFEKYVFSLDNIIFPLVLLKGKYYIKSKNTPKAIDTYSESINNYNSYLSSAENKNDINNIITIEKTKSLALESYTTDFEELYLELFTIHLNLYMI